MQVRGIAALRAMAGGLSVNVGARTAPTLGAFVKPAFVASAVDLTNLTTYTFTAAAIGTDIAAPDHRYTIVCVAGTSGGLVKVSTLTVGGRSATLAKAYGGNVNCATEIWIVDTTGLGTTADVVVTWSGANSGTGVVVYRMINPGSAVPIDTDAKLHAAGAVTLDLDIPTGGGAVAVVVSIDTVLGTHTWTGTATPTENFDGDQDASDAMSAAVSTLDGAGRTMIATSTRTAPTNMRGAAASWGP